jgi:hypothetical protein
MELRAQGFDYCVKMFLTRLRAPSARSHKSAGSPSFNKRRRASDGEQDLRRFLPKPPLHIFEPNIIENRGQCA